MEFIPTKVQVWNGRNSHRTLVQREKWGETRAVKMFTWERQKTSLRFYSSRTEIKHWTALSLSLLSTLIPLPLPLPPHTHTRTQTCTHTHTHTHTHILNELVLAKKPSLHPVNGKCWLVNSFFSVKFRMTHTNTSHRVRTLKPNIRELLISLEWSKIG